MARADLIPPDTLSLMTTFACNAACAHCSVFSGPARRETFPTELARSVIDEAAKTRSIKMIAYTGGEPMLEYERLLELMEYASARGLQAGLVSNSSWAVDAETARQRFREMVARGLTVYITSLDEYHLEYIELEAIRRAIHASLEQSVATHLNVLWTPGYATELDNLAETLQLPPSLIDRGNGRFHVWFNRPSRVRKVRDLVPPGPLPAVDGQVAGPCDHILRHPIVSTNGTVHMCCGTADSSPLGPARFSAAGNVQTEPLHTILERGRNDLLFNLMARVGPYGVYQMVRSAMPDPVPVEEFANACEVCGRLQQPDMKPHLAATLAELRDRAAAPQRPKAQSHPVRVVRRRD
jgi:hypothetical protein